MLFDRAGRAIQYDRDFLVPFAFHHPMKNLPFTLCEREILDQW
jgi:hypothetical protein